MRTSAVGHMPLSTANQLLRNKNVLVYMVHILIFLVKFIPMVIPFTGLSVIAIKHVSRFFLGKFTRLCTQAYILFL